MTTIAPTITRPRPSWATPSFASTPDRGMRVLVAVDVTQTATREIATALVRALPRTAAGRRNRLTAVLVPVQRCPDPTSFDAVVLGAAVGDGRWLEPAQRYADIVTAALGHRPIWFFTSDPSGGDRTAVDWWADESATTLTAR
jgi:menaquinone-dependent protoporphyrinogen IX oxidase